MRQRTGVLGAVLLLLLHANKCASCASDQQASAGAPQRRHAARDSEDRTVTVLRSARRRLHATEAQEHVERPDAVPDAGHQEQVNAALHQQAARLFDAADPGKAHAIAAAKDGSSTGGDSSNSRPEGQHYLQRDGEHHPDAALHEDDVAARQQHLAARHDARYKHHLQRTQAPPPHHLQRRTLETDNDGQHGDSGEVASDIASPRTLQRSDGFRKSAAEVQDIVTGTELRPHASILEVLVMTTIMAAVSGLGAVPFFFVGSLSAEWAALANAIACGVMLAASFDLVHEGQPYGGGLTILGVALGALFIKASQEWLEKWEDIKFEGLQGINAQKTLLLVAVMAAHALGEGSGVGVSFCGHRGWAQGVLVTLAIGLHNIPEGLAVATVLVARGVSPKSALIWSVLTSMPQPAVAVPSFMFVTAFRALLPVALGFAAGCMVWMVFAELLPDALDGAAHGKVATAATFSAAWLEALRMALALLERPDGSLASPFAADPAAALGVLTILLPAALPAAAAGGLVSALFAPGPVLLGIAAGIMAWSGTASLLSSAWSGSPGLFWGGVWSAVGTAAVAALWRWLRPSLLKLKAEAMNRKEHDTIGVNGSVHTNGETWIPAAGEMIASLSPRAADALRMPWDAEEAKLQPLGMNGGPRSMIDGGLHPVGSGMLPMYMQGPPPPDGRAAASVGMSARGGVPLPAWGPQVVAAGVAAAALLADGLPVGWRAGARAAGGAGQAGALWLPLALDALLRGVAGAALAPQLLGRTLRRTVGLALALGGAPVAAAALQVLRTPSTADGAATAAAALVGVAPQVQAAAAGAMLAASLGLLMPAAHWLRGVSANKGFVVGCVAAAVVRGLTSVLCMATPYCLSVASE